MNLSMTRIWAVVRKELRDYRRNRFIASTMAFMPVLFIALPIIQIFRLSGSSLPAGVMDKVVGLPLLYLLVIPAIVPAVVSSAAVVGEREQGTLEPVLTTPLRREEFLLGKALAVLVPTLVISYTMFGIFLACVALFADTTVASDIFQAPRLLIQLVFTPLLAGWSIWACIAISTRANDIRVAQQLGTLSGLPPLAVTALMAFDVIQPTVTLALSLAAALLLIDIFAWRLVAMLFQRERLITGGKT